MKKGIHTILTKLWYLLTRNLSKLSFFVVIFALSKVTVFVAPLLLSNLSKSSESYGFIEYAITLGTLILSIINLGMSGAYPYFNIRLRQSGYISIFYFHLILTLIFLSLSFVGMYIGLIPDKIFFSLLIASIFSIQLQFSAQLKSTEYINLAVILDSGFYLVLLVYCGILFTTKALFTLIVFEIIIGTYATFLFVIAIIKFFQTKADFSFVNYKNALRFGMPLVLSAFLITSLTGSTRVFIEYFLGLKNVGYYSFYFRLSAITVIAIHQVINIAFFRKIYEAKPEILDNYLSFYLSFIACLNLVSYWILPQIALPYFGILRDTYDQLYLLYFILSIQMVYWVSNAFCENIIYRENLATKMNVLFIGIVGTMIGILFILHHYELLNLNLLAIINMVAIYGSTEAQFYLFRQKGIDFKKTRLVNGFILVFFFAVYAIL